MDYKEKYQQALERAKQGIKDCGDNEGRKKMIYNIFPSLAENEDERIREAIIQFLKVCLGINDKYPKEYSSESLREMISWLEEQKDKDALIKELGEYKTKYIQETIGEKFNERKNMQENKDDERLRKTTISFLKEFADQGYENAVECIDWLEKQKPVEWSEEDEKILMELLHYHESCLGCLATEERHKESRRWVDWLNSLKQRIGG